MDSRSTERAHAPITVRIAKASWQTLLLAFAVAAFARPVSANAHVPAIVRLIPSGLITLFLLIALVAGAIAVVAAATDSVNRRALLTHGGIGLAFAGILSGLAFLNMLSARGEAKLNDAAMTKLMADLDQTIATTSDADRPRLCAQTTRRAAERSLGSQKLVLSALSDGLDSAAGPFEACVSDLEKIQTAGGIQAGTLVTLDAIHSRRAQFKELISENRTLAAKLKEARATIARIDAPPRVKEDVAFPLLDALLKRTEGEHTAFLAMDDLVGILEAAMGHWQIKDGKPVFERDEDRDAYNRFLHEVQFTAQRQQADPTDSPVRTVPPGSLKPGPLRRSTLSAEQERRIREVRGTLAEVDTSSYEDWADGFRRDVNPDSEIAVWERIASAYRRYTSARKLTAAQKDDAFTLLLTRSMAPAADTLRTAKLKALSQEEARDVLATYDAAPVRIRVQ